MMILFGSHIRENIGRVGVFRRVAERHWPFFVNCHWACSAMGIDWKAYGLAGARLAYLLSECGLFHYAHRALDDCHAVLEILALDLPGTSNPGLRLCSIAPVALSTASGLTARRSR